MKQNFWWLAGALSGIAIVLIVFLIKRVTRGKDKDFDERQTAARGKAPTGKPTAPATASA